MEIKEKVTAPVELEDEVLDAVGGGICQDGIDGNAGNVGALMVTEETPVMPVGAIMEA